MAADVHHPLHHALLNDNMLQRQFSIERVARHSVGREALKMDHSQPHACNLIGFFDKNITTRSYRLIKLCRSLTHEK